jgi:hypothetical protein
MASVDTHVEIIFAIFPFKPTAAELDLRSKTRTIDVFQELVDAIGNYALPIVLWNRCTFVPFGTAILAKGANVHFDICFIALESFR